VSVPFIVFTAGRSRSYWLSHFLTYGEHKCWHDKMLEFSTVRELQNFLCIPRTGMSDSGAALYAVHAINNIWPMAKRVVVRRPVEDVVTSFIRMQGYHPRLRDVVDGLQPILSFVSSMPGTLTVNFDDLDEEKVCRSVFEHCLPYRFDRGHWLALRDWKLSVNFADVMRYTKDNEQRIASFMRETRWPVSLQQQSSAAAR
jgi:hypothetical protein